jgi:hypothetical protein
LIWSVAGGQKQSEFRIPSFAKAQDSIVLKTMVFGFIQSTAPVREAAIAGECSQEFGGKMLFLNLAFFNTWLPEMSY